MNANFAKGTSGKILGPSRVLQLHDQSRNENFPPILLVTCLVSASPSLSRAVLIPSNYGPDYNTSPAATW